MAGCPMPLNMQVLTVVLCITSSKTTWLPTFSSWSKAHVPMKSPLRQLLPPRRYRWLPAGASFAASAQSDESVTAPRTAGW